MASQPPFGIIGKLYRLLIVITSNLQSLFLLAIRLTWGYQFFLTGKGKLMNLDRTTHFFESLNIPMPKINAIMAGSTECFGGLLLAAGLAGRLISVPLTVVMVVAYATADRDSFESLDKFVASGPFPFAMTVLIVLFFGPGRFSVDYLLQRVVFKRRDSLEG